MEAQYRVNDELTSLNTSFMGKKANTALIVFDVRARILSRMAQRGFSPEVNLLFLEYDNREHKIFWL